MDGKAIAPFVSLYLLAIGAYIIFKALRPVWPRAVRDWAVPFIGAAGGTLDAIGGGGWGPIVTSSLIGRGHVPQTVIGSTNLTEFLVTAVITATFILTIGWSDLNSAVGLIIGGVLAAPDRRLCDPISPDQTADARRRRAADRHQSVPPVAMTFGRAGPLRLC